MSKKRRPNKPHRPPAPATPAPARPPAFDVREAAPAPGDAAVETAAVSNDAVAIDGPDGAIATEHAPVTANGAAAEPASTRPDAATSAATASIDTVSAPVERQRDDEASAISSAVPAAAADRGAMPAAFPSSASSDIRGVLIQVAGARLLLPNATIAEVLSYADPEPVGGDAPDWLLGRMRWRGWQLPLIAFGTLAGVSAERGGLGSKVVVLKALAGTGKTPYFAMLTQGFPRLVTVSRDGLVLEDDTADAMPRGVQARVRLNENEALLPDLEALEAWVTEALAQAA